MKSIVVVNNSSKKISYLLNNLMDYEIDKNDHILHIHRIVDGEALWDSIQLKDNTFDRLPIDFSWDIVPFCEIVDRRMEEFLADDDDEPILDISKYVDQDVMMRDDESEEEGKWVCSETGEDAVFMTGEEIIAKLPEKDEDAYIETLDLGGYLAWLTKTGKMESILKDLGRLEKWRKQVREEEEEEKTSEPFRRVTLMEQLETKNTAHALEIAQAAAYTQAK